MSELISYIAQQPEAYEDKGCKIPVKPGATVGYREYNGVIHLCIKIRDRVWMPQEEASRLPVIQLLPQMIPLRA